MPQVILNRKWTSLLLVSLVLTALFVVACGEASTTSTGAGNAQSVMRAPVNSASGSSSSNQNKSLSSSVGQQYLIKSLNVSMEVKDTQQVANDLQAWISTTDPRSTVGGINYQQVGDNLYNVSMSFTVEATLYPQIESYLSNYTTLHKGKLLSLNETVQDVSNDYVDTQSRLKNLHGEQDRLLTLLSHAQVLGDILAIEQRLTDVEGQIESIEAHLNQLSGQVTFYTISISLQPSQALLTPSPSAWNPGTVWQNALSAATAFAQVLATVFIWLVVFSVYILPLALIAWLVRWWRRTRLPRAIPATASANPPQAGI